MKTTSSSRSSKQGYDATLQIDILTKRKDFAAWAIAEDIRQGLSLNAIKTALCQCNIGVIEVLDSFNLSDLRADNCQSRAVLDIRLNITALSTCPVSDFDCIDPTICLDDPAGGQIKNEDLCVTQIRGA